MTIVTPATEPRNRFLQLLGNHGFADQQMERCDMASGTVLYEPGQDIDAAYFPVDCIVSLVVTLSDNRPVEATTVGNEGMVGLPVALNGSKNRLRAVVQIPGHAYKLGVEPFMRAYRKDESLQDLVFRYTLARMDAMAQSVACNRLHTVRQRMCRWLLICQDRINRDDFALTQKFLAEMLAVQRPTVSEIAARLQHDGLISYRRGKMRILDRDGLCDNACECYDAVRGEFDALLGAQQTEQPPCDD